MAITIKIENFEGPMDLLLHLVEKNKFNIYEINISKLIDDYLEYIITIKKNSLEIKVEFLLMATELMEIKALSILNKKEKEEKEEKLELRIREYKLFKEISEELAVLEKEYNIPYTKDGEAIRKIIHGDVDLSTLSLETLFAEYKKIIEKNKKIEMEIDLEVRYSIEDGLNEIGARFMELGECLEFGRLIGNDFSRIKIVIIFLAVLELYKLNRIDIEGQKNIILKKKGQWD